MRQSIKSNTATVMCSTLVKVVSRVVMQAYNTLTVKLGSVEQTTCPRKDGSCGQENRKSRHSNIHVHHHKHTSTEHVPMGFVDVSLPCWCMR